MSVFGLMLLGSVSAQDLRPPGEMVPDALALHVTGAGLDAIEVVVAELIPTLLADAIPVIDDIDLAGILTLENVKPIIIVRTVQMTPRTGVLDVLARMRINLNSPSDPLHIGGICDEWGWIGPMDADLLVRLSINVVVDQDGTRSFDVGLDTTFDIDIDPPGLFSEGDFHLGICGSILGSVLGIFKSALIGIIQAPLNEALSGIEVQIEEALSGAALSQELAVLESVIQLDIEPRQVNITPEGIEVLVNMGSDTEQAECIASLDPGGSVKTAGPRPAIGANPPGTQIAAHVADDGIAQLLYAAWRSGVLCYTVDAESGLDLPIALDTSLLALLGGEGFREVVGPVAKPLVIKTLPYEVPDVTFDGAHDIEAKINRLGLGFYGELDGRMARLLNVEADVDAGVDLNFDTTTGSLAIAVDLAGDALKFRVVPDSIVAGTEAATQEALTGLIGGLVPQLVGPLLGDLAFAIPSFSGLGVTSLDVYSTDPEWLVASLGVGTAPEGAADGCASAEEGGGCACDSESSCDSGCSQASARWTPVLTGLIAAWALRRRRR